MSSKTSSTTNNRESTLSAAILVCYCLFAFGSTFSIALAQLSLGASAALFLATLIHQRQNPFGGRLRVFYTMLGILIVWKILTCFISAHPIDALDAMRDDWLYIAVPIGVWLMQVERNRRFIIYALLAGVVVVSIYAIVQNTTGFEYRGRALAPAPDFGYRAVGTFPHQLTFGNYYAIVAMFFLGAGVIAIQNHPLRWRTFLLGSAGLAGVASALSYSRGSIVAMIPAIVVASIMLLRSRAKWIALVILVVAAGFVASHPGLIQRMSTGVAKDQATDNFMSRPFIWKHSLEVVAEHPLFGVGPGQFKESYVAKIPADIPDRGKHSHAHNDILQSAAESGIIGAMLFCALWFVLFMQGIKGMATLQSFDMILPVGALFGMGTFLLTGLTEATFFDEEVRQMVMLICAFALWPLGGVAISKPE